MSNVFVINTKKQPLNPVHPGSARWLLTQGKAAVFKRYPFTIILKSAVDTPTLEPLRVKLDPGSKTTGIAIVNDATGNVVFAAELTHPGQAIKHALDQRRGVRRGRRKRRCAYCGKENIPLQIEHMHCRAKGGSNRISNLTLACDSCNQKKGTLDLAVFLAKKPETLKKIQAQAKAPLRDATAVNATRWALYERLQTLGLPVECGSGGRTKFNRSTRGLEKTHWLDAACVGASTPERLNIQGMVPLRIAAQGHGCRQMCLMGNLGFPPTGPKGPKKVKGFQTGDMVRAVVTKGSKIGTYTGRVAIRASGSFNITTTHQTVQGISHRFCTILHRCDGYGYQKGAAQFPPHA